MYATAPSTSLHGYRPTVDRAPNGCLPEADEDEEEEVKFEQEYKLLDIIYSGTFNCVHECLHKPTGEKYAVKVVDMPRFLSVHSKEDLANEVHICSRLGSHPHIVELLTSASSDNKFYMVYEYLESRDLCYEIEKKVASGFVYSESVASHYLRQILDALLYMHDRNIIHRDIKVNCVLLASSDHVKIGGFGAAVALPDRGFIQDSGRATGTVQYMSPEVIRREYYGKPCDVWGAGVLLFVLLTGSLPFLGKAAHVCTRVLSGPDFSARAWTGSGGGQVSARGRDLCRKMLATDQYSRISIAHALQHPWITGDNSRTPLSNTVKAMAAFNCRRKLQAAVNAVAHSTKFEEFDAAAAAASSVAQSSPVHAPPPLGTSPDVISNCSLDMHEQPCSALSRACSRAISCVVDSIDEAHILASCDPGCDPTYLNSLFEDRALTQLLKLYDRVSVDLAETLHAGHDSAPSVWARAAAALTHHVAQQLTGQSQQQQQQSSQSQQLLALFAKPAFAALLQAHDVLCAELYGSSDSSDRGGRGSSGSGGGLHSPAHSGCSTSGLGSGGRLSAVLPNGAVPNGGVPPADEGHQTPSPAAAAAAANVVRVKHVNFHRAPGEPLGIMLRVTKGGEVVVAQIFVQGVVHRQRILTEGDQILEMNGRPTRGHSNANLRRLVADISGDIVMKVRPAPAPAHLPAGGASESMFVRAMFDYRPEADTLLSSAAHGGQAVAGGGLRFDTRDVLEILRPYETSHVADDANRWWQARLVSPAAGAADDPPQSPAAATAASPVGLIPSAGLQRWRLEMGARSEAAGDSRSAAACGIFKKRKKNKLANLRPPLADDELYEPVVQAAHVRRRTLLLVGAANVGRRSMKRLLIELDRRFAYPIPHTSRPCPLTAADEQAGCEPDGGGGGGLYYHVPREEMEEAIARGEYLEHGRFDHAFFGTKFETIDRILARGLTPVLDVEPESVRRLRNAHYTPFVVFVGPPVAAAAAALLPATDHSVQDKAALHQLSRLLRDSAQLEQQLRPFIDLRVENSDLDQSVAAIRDAFDAANSPRPHWVPLSWATAADHSRTKHSSR